MTELPHYGKILLATDGSETAQLAAWHAVALTRQAGTTLTVAYVVDTHSAFLVGIHQDEALHELVQDGKRALAAVAELGREAGVQVHTELCEGRPGEAIVGEADRSGADLIVVGSHGKGALEEFLLGSVSQYVLHHTRVPVCVVGPPGR